MWSICIGFSSTTLSNNHTPPVCEQKVIFHIIVLCSGVECHIFLPIPLLISYIISIIIIVTGMFIPIAIHLNYSLRRDQRKNQSSRSLAFVRGIHQWPMVSAHKRPVTRKMIQVDDVIMEMNTDLHVCNAISLHFSTLITCLSRVIMYLSVIPFKQCP